MRRVVESTGRNLSGLCGGRVSRISAASLMMLALAAPAYAQVGNPFAGSTGELETWIGYGMTAGVIGVVTLAAIGLAKAIFRRLAS